jgi:excisionase family DNA binding protein
MEGLWNVGQVATFLGCSRGLVYQRVAEGTIPHLKIGSMVRFNPTEIREWLEGQRRGA